MIKIQILIPNKVGSKNDKNVHFTLFVSLYTVKRVVEHGECIRKNIITQMAVTIFQPFDINMLYALSILIASVSTLLEEYKSIHMGKIISLAPIPRINDVIITPSNPISLPKGSKKSDI